MKEKTMVKLPAAGRDISSITEAELADVIRDFDVIKGNIKVYLANKEAIWENHQDCPKKEVEGTDLLAVFRIMLFVKDVGQSSILVRNRTMAMWDIELESLYETALKNTMEQTPARVISLDDMIDYGPEKSKRPEEVSYENGKTYILGNSGTVGGAAAMLYPGVLQTIAENSSSNLFIVPSSINEVLVISDDGKADSQSLQYMLMEANMGMVPRKEGPVRSSLLLRQGRAEDFHCHHTRRNKRTTAGHGRHMPNQLPMNADRAERKEDDSRKLPIMT